MIETICKNDCCKKYVKLLVDGEMLCPDCGEKIVVKKESNGKEFKK